MKYHLAQINIARLIAPLDDPKIAGFVSQLEPINSVADRAPGFVWRLKSELGNATDIAYNDDPFVIVNMSVWESIESLREYAYKSDHRKVFQAQLLFMVGSCRTCPHRRRRTRKAGTLPDSRCHALFLLVLPALPPARGGKCRA
jgi:hypothetical protein